MTDTYRAADYRLAEALRDAVCPQDPGLLQMVQGELDCEGPDGPIELCAQMVRRKGLALPPELIPELRRYRNDIRDELRAGGYDNSCAGCKQFAQKTIREIDAAIGYTIGEP